VYVLTSGATVDDKKKNIKAQDPLPVLFAYQANMYLFFLKKCLWLWLVFFFWKF